MRLYLAALILAACSASAQNIIDPTRVPQEWKDFKRRTDEAKLDCEVRAIKPRINYSFRFQTGYAVRIPAKQYAGKGHWVASFFRVTPEHAEREPVYFASRHRLPEIPPDNKATLEFGGGYVVGEGRYRVEWLVTDDTGRVCADNWNIEAKLGRKERGVEPGMAPGVVEEISLRKWTRGSPGANDEEGHRVTILMNANPVMPRRIRLGSYDRVLLLSSLAAAIERLPLKAVRLVVFSLDQQREIYRNEAFEPRDFGAVSQALTQLELGIVDYGVLKNRRGHIDLLTDLMSESLTSEGSDAILFLGPKPWQFDKVSRSDLSAPEQHAPFFYVQFRPFIYGATIPDTIMNAVKQVDGKTFEVYSPGDFASAIRDINRALAGSDPR